jgi:protein-disulfide isomerase
MTRVFLSVITVANLALSLGGSPPRLEALAAEARTAPQGQDELDRRFLEAWAQQRRLDPGVPAAGAKVVVVKFNDWMCPGCKFMYIELKPILAKYQAKPGMVKYVEKDWPWNAKCNLAVKTIPGHEASCDAAAAVRIAADRGKRELMVDWLYANQEGMTPEKVRAKAAEMLAVSDFSAGYGLKLSAIQKDVADGQAVEVRSTPTYFVNGIRAVDAQGSPIPAHYFDIAIQYELQRVGAK